MSFHLSPDDYWSLYAKYITDGTPPENMLNWADFKTGDRVLDLGAGALLRISKLAFLKGAGYVVAIDPTYSSWIVDIRVDPDLSVIESFPALKSLYNAMYVDEHTHHIYLDDHTIQFSLRTYSDPLFVDGMQFDVAVCQQAVNYWFDKETIEHLAMLIVPGKKFVFNTFNTLPPTTPNYKTYNINGKVYGEAFYLVRDMVHHWQGREGLPPHVTSFRWIPRSEFTNILDPYFRVTLITEKNSDLYVCVKK